MIRLGVEELRQVFQPLATILIWQGDNAGIYVFRQGEITQIGTGRQACHPLISDQGLMVWAGGSLTNYYNAMYICEYKEVFDVTGRVVLENGNNKVVSFKAIPF